MSDIARTILSVFAARACDSVRHRTLGVIRADAVRKPWWTDSYGAVRCSAGSCARTVSASSDGDDVFYPGSEHRVGPYVFVWHGLRGNDYCVTVLLASMRVEMP